MKNITFKNGAGDCVILTDRELYAAKVRVLRSHECGIERKYGLVDQTKGTPRYGTPVPHKLVEALKDGGHDEIALFLEIEPGAPRTLAKGDVKSLSRRLEATDFGLETNAKRRKMFFALRDLFSNAELTATTVEIA